MIFMVNKSLLEIFIQIIYDSIYSIVMMMSSIIVFRLEGYQQKQV